MKNKRNKTEKKRYLNTPSNFYYTGGSRLKWGNIEIMQSTTAPKIIGSRFPSDEENDEEK